MGKCSFPNLISGGMVSSSNYIPYYHQTFLQKYELLMDNSDIEEITLSVVREYLSSKNLKKSLQTLDEEIPRTENSISKRTSLIKILHFEKLMKRNKERKKPLESILELVIKYCLEKRLEEKNIKDIQMKNKMQSNRGHLVYSGTETISKNMTNYDSLSKERNIIGEINENINLNYTNNRIQDHNSKPSMQDHTHSKVFDDITLDDVEELDNNFQYGLYKKPTVNRSSNQSVEISVPEMMKLKQLLFGSQTGNFSDEWKLQNLKFSDNLSLKYGLVQHKGGPCGVLASLQSFIIKELLFPMNGEPIGLNPSEVEQDRVLSSAISQILWRAGQEKKAVVAVLENRLSSMDTTGFSFELLQLFHCNSFELLEQCVHNNLAVFKNEYLSGCIAFLCSAILSKGIDNIRSEMDEPEGRLLGAHGYCTQEVVNLLLTGQSVSNVFDGIVELDSGGSEKMILHGISSTSPIGFLSLFEHYQSCTVGKFLKNPIYPIWVVCSESHFSVLFSKDYNLTQSTKEPLNLELIFYDGLSKQDSEIKLILDFTKDKPLYSDNDLISPLEHCIRTKWSNAVVSWIGCDPIL